MMNLAWWLLLAFICGNATAKYQNQNEIDINKLLANIPEDVLNQAHLFLEDPSRLVTFFLNTDKRSRGKRSIRNKEYTLESLNARMNISFNNKENPLEAFKADISIDRLDDLLYTYYEKADLTINFRKTDQKSFILSVHYIFHNIQKEKENGTIHLEYSLDGPSFLKNVRSENSVMTVIPTFSFILNPVPEDKPEIHEDSNEYEKEGPEPEDDSVDDPEEDEDKPEIYEDSGDDPEAEDPTDEVDDVEIEKRDIFLADNATLFIGNFTDLDYKKYFIKIRDNSEGWYWSNRRNKSQTYKKFKTANLNSKIDGIVLDQTKNSYYDIITGYNLDTKRTKTYFFDDALKTDYDFTATFKKFNYSFTLRKNKHNKQKMMKILELIFKTTEDSWTFHQTIKNQKILDLKFSISNNVDFELNFFPNRLKSICPNQRFGLCKPYSIKIWAHIDKEDMKKVDISAYLKSGTEYLMDITLSTERQPYRFIVQSSRYLPSILPDSSEKFELEVQSESPNVFKISKASLKDLNFWTAVKANPSSLTLKLNNSEICTISYTLGVDQFNIATRAPDKFNTTITTSVSWNSNDWKEQTIIFDTSSTKQGAKGPKRMAKAKIVWDVVGLSSTPPRDIKFEMSGNGGSDEKFGVFYIKRELLIHPSLDYINFNSKETIYSKNPENYSFEFTKEPIQLTIKS